MYTRNVVSTVQTFSPSLQFHAIPNHAINSFCSELPWTISLPLQAYESLPIFSAAGRTASVLLRTAVRDLLRQVPLELLRTS